MLAMTQLNVSSCICHCFLTICHLVVQQLLSQAGDLAVNGNWTGESAYIEQVKLLLARLYIQTVLKSPSLITSV